MKAIIAAVSPSGVIGLNGVMPWHYPEDLKWFQKLTHGCTVVMGRKTFESLPERYRPLPERINIVLSKTIPSTSTFQCTNEYTGKKSSLRFASDIDIEDFHDKTVFFIGGAEIYKLAMPTVDRIFITRIPKEYNGDTYFPYWPLEDFGWEVAVVHGETDSGLQFLEYVRRNNAYRCD